MRDLEKGSRLKNRYLLIKKIGMGGMSLVWLAHDEQTDQKVAIKLLKEDLAKKSFYKNLFNMNNLSVSNVNLDKSIVIPNEIISITTTITNNTSNTYKNKKVEL